MPHHSLTLQQGKQYALPPSHQSFVIQNIALSKFVSNERSSVVLISNDTPTIICNLIPEKIESQSFNLPLQTGSDVKLFLVGENEVDILYYVEA